MLYFFIIFLSAALLFMIQPIVAKAILPWFGGGASVWTTCMMFFQVFLLAGYSYAHALTHFLSNKKQAMVHGVLVVVSFVSVPVAISNADLMLADNSPVLEIMGLLTVSIGLPYFVLSSTGPLLQRWFSYEKPGQEPYKLYALSNVGSLLGLVIYPFVIEPSFIQQTQFYFWSSGYLLYGLASLVMVAHVFKLPNALKESMTDFRVDCRALASWVVLSMLGVVLLLAVTNAMTQNIASVPFLWLLPLTLYLLSFIICFAQDKYYQRKFWSVALILMVLASYLLYFFAGYFDFATQVVLFSMILIVGCMLCHGELAKLKPKPSHLTLYYLAISGGGFLGGLFVSIAAPALFSQLSEFPLVVYALVLSLSFVLWRSWSQDTSTRFVLIKTWLLGLSLIVLPLSFMMVESLFTQHDVVSSRNFYGPLAVKDITVGELNERRLVDGTTSHGTQSLDVSKQDIPLSYYRAGTGVALAIDAVGERGPINVGVVGLGAGTLAAYGRSGDQYAFYELNPRVKQYALEHFSYLADTLATVNIYLGDGRLTLTRQLSKGSRKFDLLVIDAFSSDAIPTHLLTTQAISLYLAHINSNGIIAFHVSNNHLDLTPLLRGLAQHAGVHAKLYLKRADEVDRNLAQWVLLAKDAKLLNSAELNQQAVSWSKTSKNSVIWTDDFSNLLSVMKY